MILISSLIICILAIIGEYDENNNLIHSIYTASNYSCDQDLTATLACITSIFMECRWTDKVRVVPDNLVTHPLAIIMITWKFQLYTLTHLQLQ